MLQFWLAITPQKEIRGDFTHFALSVSNTISNSSERKDELDSTLIYLGDARRV